MHVTAPASTLRPNYHGQKKVSGPEEGVRNRLRLNLTPFQLTPFLAQPLLGDLVVAGKK